MIFYIIKCSECTQQTTLQNEKKTNLPTTQNSLVLKLSPVHKQANLVQSETILCQSYLARYLIWGSHLLSNSSTKIGRYTEVEPLQNILHKCYYFGTLLLLWYFGTADTFVVCI